MKRRLFRTSSTTALAAAAVMAEGLWAQTTENRVAGI